MIAGIVLAAGSSSRLGRPKQLLPIGGEPLLRYTLRRVLASTLDRVVVVIAHDAEGVRQAVASLPVEVVDNFDAARGQSTSVVAGLRALGPEIDAAVFLLGDQPGVDPAVIDALVTTWKATGAAIVAPRYTDGIGNPVLFSRVFFGELEQLEGDEGARAIVRAHQDDGSLQPADVEAPAPPDIDDERDYQAFLASLPLPSTPLSRRSRETPPPVEGGWGGRRGLGGEGGQRSPRRRITPQTPPRRSCGRALA